MRLWSIHPKYLDSKGLVAAWREALLAKKVLAGQTKGYRHHPQLDRFKMNDDPLAAIEAYLTGIYAEAVERQYHFDRSKLTHITLREIIPVTSGQIQYEFQHLLNKLEIREHDRFLRLSTISRDAIEVSPVFRLIHGAVESWEKPISR